ncbi:MAG: GcrA family cell cycle regulator [Alphaproteobacteria bacterium]|nr:GcrA family cell cycle regulator [Alphaproteobacteria bacterium]
MSWTEQQIQALKKMWGNGFSASDIAKTLGGGLTRNAVIGKAHRLKLSSSPAAMRQGDGAPVKVGGSVLPTMTKVSKKRTMLRPLPPVQMPDISTKPMTRDTLRVLDQTKRTEGIAVTKAGERHCRWPIGDPRSPDFRFCGCNCHEGLPYCVDHARVAYQTVSRRSRAGNNDNPPEFRLPNTSRY